MGNTVRTVLTGALVAGLMMTGANAVVADPVPIVDWQPCEENTAVECAAVTVPIDWAYPAEGTIEMAVARRAAPEPIGTLVYMPGGPGDSGVDAILDEDRFPAELAARFDLVSFDPRGIARSNPVRCDAELVGDFGNVIPDTGVTLTDLVARSEALGRSCREHTGPLIDHLDSVSVARDIEALRSALGERRITLYGRSYGTLAGQMYAELFPHRVRAMLLDSVFDHSLSTEDLVASQARAAEDSFAEFAAWCADDPACALHGQDVNQVFADLYERSVRGDLPGTTTFDLLRTTIRSFYQPDWVAAANRLAGLADQEPRADQQPRAAGVAEFTFGSFCADNNTRIPTQRAWERLWRTANAAAPTMRTHFAWPILTMCSAWPAQTGNPQHRTDIDGGPTVLLMNSLHDPADPYEWATSVAGQLDDSVLLTYDGWGHGVTGRTDCTTAAAVDYLVDRVVPAEGSSCPAVPAGR